jgi:hypothetical protein
MDLAIRDIRLNKYKQQIDINKRILMEKYLELQKNAKENEYLNGVVDDYKKYFNFMIEEKNQQYDALNMISQYLDNINSEIKSTDEVLDEQQQEQKKIMREMSKIKENLDELVSVHQS